MGFVLSKFRKEKSTQVILEGLQTQIQELEKHMINTQEKKRRFVANFVGFTIGAYIVGFALFYFFYFPPTTQGRIMYLVPLLLFPVLIILLRQMFTWYFQRKLNKNGDKLSQLKEKKSKILEQVMDKETYKVAVNLLERFGDKKQSRLTGQLATQTRAQSLQSLNRTLPGTPKPSTPQPAAALAARQQPQRPLTPYTSVYRNVNNNLNTSALSLASSSPQLPSGQELRRRTPFPITDDRSRSALDRLMDFIVGDTPSNRFGMICKECHAHNGMLPQEEYEYTTFRCAFCNALNPSRKKRPVGPLITVDAAPGSLTPLSARRNVSSDSDSSSDEERTSTDKQPLIRRALLPDLPATATTETASEANEINSTTVTEMEIDEQIEEVKPEPEPELEPEPESETVISKAVAEELAIK
ncbi:endoplasmic reticulum junction formation protein lunapark-A isoform X2 [Drosophila tropicalis]|uniref:endoplasmic reticulum junction formation protein lunapark-A isoform X2 n=1 Tax=Drosophila tropicalis TaxID=46794 RepID=UPI0035AB84C5